MRRMITDKLTKNIKEVVKAYEDGEIALTEDITEVVANPTLAGDEAELTGLQVGDTKYAMPQGGGGSQLYAHNIMITGGDNTTGNNFSGVVYLISQDSEAITASNLITKLIAAGYDSTTKRAIFTGSVYLASDTKICALMYLARQTNSDTSIRVGYASDNGAGVGNASLTIDITSTDITFLVADTVIAL